MTNQQSLTEFQARINDLVVHLSNESSPLEVPPSIGEILDQIVLTMMRPTQDSEAIQKTIVERIVQALLIAGQLGINVEKELDSYLAELESYTIMGS